MAKLRRSKSEAKCTFWQLPGHQLARYAWNFSLPVESTANNHKFNGAFRTLSGPQLGAVAIKAAVAKANIPVEVIQDVYMGNVLQANEGQAPARQAALFAGLPSSVEAVTINKVCASGLKAVIFAAQNIQMGLADAQVAGGFESMSRVPYYLPRPAQGPVLGAQTAEDGLIKDGLLDVYNECLMGACADHSARQEGISRKSQDDFAIQSYRRAQKAWKEGRFDEEIAPVTIETKTGKVQIKVDEGYLDLKESRIPGLKPAFVHDGSGTITAANSSTMNDGGSAVVLVSEKLAALYSSLSHKLCQIISYADAALDPMDYSLAPAKAISIALKRASLQKEDIALWEVNEAFAAVIKITEKVCIILFTTRPGTNLRVW